MPFLAYIIIPFVIFLIMPIAMAILQKNAGAKESKLNKNEFIMQASKSFRVLIIVFTTIWAALVIMLNFIDDVTIWVNIILWFGEGLLIVCCVQSLRQKIIVKTLDLYYTPMFGKTRITAIKDIEKVVRCFYSRSLIKYKIYANSKVFCSFAESAVGAKLLIDLFSKADISIVDKE